MKFAWQKLTDERGVKCRCCQLPQACKASGKTRSEIIQRGDMSSFWGPFLWIGCLIVCLSLIGILLFPIVGIPVTEIQINRESAFGFLFGWIFHGTIFGFLASRYIWKNRTAAARAMMRTGLCPACAYQIHDIEPDPDGCTVCPECGAAWRLSDASV